MNKWKRIALACCLLAVAVPGTRGTAQQDARPIPCQTEQHRAFDFWVGEWVVYGAGEAVAGHSKIERVLNGCAIHETWTSARGGHGNSYSFYDQANGKWHQTWIDVNGAPLYLDGEWTGSAMVLSDGTNRVTWTREDGGRVRQLWESTSDGGATWTPAFDGDYVPDSGE